MKQIFKYSLLQPWRFQTRLLGLLVVSLVFLSCIQLGNSYLAKMEFKAGGVVPSQKLDDIQSLHQITRLLNSTKSLFLDVSMYTGSTRNNAANVSSLVQRDELRSLAQRLNDNSSAIKKLWQEFAQNNPESSQGNFAMKFVAVNEKIESNILQPLNESLRGGQMQLAQELAQIGLASINTSLLSIEALIDLIFESKKIESKQRQFRFETIMTFSLGLFILGVVAIVGMYVSTTRSLKKVFGDSPEAIQLAIGAITHSVDRFDRSRSESSPHVSASVMTSVKRLHTVFKTLIERVARAESQTVIGSLTLNTKSNSVSNAESLVASSRIAARDEVLLEDEVKLSNAAIDAFEKKHSINPPAKATEAKKAAVTKKAAEDEQDWKLF